jgi:two-component system phosphate regulon response regulator OmpR
MADDAHILVVEDNAPLRERLGRYLSTEGFRVTLAADAGEARAKLRVVAPDLMVLDVMMSGETGLELTESLRREQNSDLPVLLLTARGAPEDRIAGFEAGADDYLGKPFEPRELVLRIRALLRRVPAASPPVSRTTPSSARSSPRSASKLSTPSWIGPEGCSVAGAGARRNSARMRSTSSRGSNGLPR